MKAHNDRTIIGKNSKFTFIRDINGLMNKKSYLLLSGTGKGKSTICRSLAFDLSVESKVYFYSTEEQLDDWNYFNSFSRIKSENILFRGEDFFKDKVGGMSDADELLRLIAFDVVKNNCDVIIFDNLTTSFYYSSLKPNEQSVFFDKLKDMITKINVPMFIVAHTASDVGKYGPKILDGNDIRGSKHASNKSEYIFCFQSILFQDSDDRDRILPVIYVDKDRYDGNSGNVYKLEFDSSTKLYELDTRATWELIKQTFKKSSKNLK